MTKLGDKTVTINDVKKELEDIQKFEWAKSIQVGDTFKADERTWTVVDFNEGVSVQWDKYLINVCTIDKAVFVYRLFKNGSTHHVDWSFSFDEIKMVAEIIERVEDRGVK